MSRNGSKIRCGSRFYSVVLISSVVNGSVGSAVVSSDAGVGSVSVVLSGCVGAGAVAEGSGVVVSLSAGAGAGTEGSGVVVSLSAGELLGVVSVVGAVGAAGSMVTMLFGSWVLLCCEPVAAISPLS